MNHLSSAEAAFRAHNSLLMLPLVLLAKADARRRMSDWQGASECCDEALHLCSARRLILIQFQSMILRGRIRLDKTQAELDPVSQAMDYEYELKDVLSDADHALEKAGHHGYRWLERDALLLLADGEAAVARAYRRQADSLAKKLVGTARKRRRRPTRPKG